MHKNEDTRIPDRGLIVKAFVGLNNRYDSSESLIKEREPCCEAYNHPEQVPTAIEFVDSLPKTISGKIKRNDLREREYKKSMTQKYCPKEGVTFNFPYIY